MNGVLSSMPVWAGTVPQWGMLLTFFFAVYKLSFTDAAAIRKEMIGRINGLKKDHQECEERLDKAFDKIRGLERQRISEQIAIMRAILRTVEDPGLRNQLGMLEAMQMMEPVEELGNVEGDSNA